jgi:hypothetical protein
MPTEMDDPEELRLEEEEEEEEEHGENEYNEGGAERRERSTRIPPLGVNFNYCEIHGGYVGSKCPGCK